MNETLRQIAEEVAVQTGISADDMLSRSRKLPVRRARWHIWKRLAERGWSSMRIGKVWNFDHTTILHGLGMVGAKLRRCPPPMPVLSAPEEQRRAEIIKRYWAQRGVSVEVRIELVPGEKDSRVAGVRTKGIPVQEI